MYWELSILALLTPMFISCSLSLILLSVWNGAGYYVEVWGRRFERELEALKREIQAAQVASSAAADDSAPTTRPASRGESEDEGAIDDDVKKDV